MYNFFVRNPWLYCQSLLQVGLMGGGLALSVGSSGSSKNSVNSAVTVGNSQCRASRPSFLREAVDRYSLSCRYNGGTPKFTFTKKQRLGNTVCPDGMYLYGVDIRCIGAGFSSEITPRERPAHYKLPTAAEAKAAMMKAIVDGHNGYRAVQNLKPLEWNDRLAELAEKWADHLASLGGKRLVPSKATGQGENLWMGPVDSFNYKAILKFWSLHAGQRAQMMNPRATKIGCFFRRAGKNIIGVCRYWPPIK